MSKIEFPHSTILMERMPLDGEMYFYRIIGGIKGIFNDETKIFTDEYGDVYYKIDDAYMMGYDSEETYGIFHLCYSDDELMKKYPSEDKNKSISHFVDDMRSLIWFGVPDENEDSINIVGISKKDIKGLPKLINSELEISENNDFDLDIVLSEELFDELLKIEDISKIKSRLKEILVSCQNDANKALNDLGMPDAYANGQRVAKQEEYEELFDEAIEKQEKAKDQKKNQILAQDKRIPIHKLIDVEKMKKYITDRVKGQDKAVQQIITVFMMNRLAIELGLDEDELTRTLLTGPTGCGKTMIMETLIEFLENEYNLHFPIAKVATSQLTSAGYVGSNLEDILETLIQNTKGNFADQHEKIKYAETHGIVYLDEIDKKGSHENGDVAGRDVLNALLQFMSGADYEIGRGAYTYKFNTKKLTFILSGSFDNVYNHKESKPIGFGANLDPYKKEPTLEDFVEKGSMTREFMGRIHRIIRLDSLSKDTQKEILLKGKKSVLLTTKKALKPLDVDLKWSPEYIDAVVEESERRKAGARALKGIVSESLSSIEWEALRHQKPITIEVSAETIKDPTKIVIKPKVKEKTKTKSTKNTKKD